jgi:RimJ/RimL family protein N-acetyltransferase
MSDQQKIRMLNTSDAAEFARHLARTVSEEDSTLVPISSPFPRSFKVDEAVSIETSLRSWNNAVDNVGWTRTWGIFSGEKIVGEVSLSNSRLIETQRHRAILSMGIEREFRSQGLGSLLLSKALNWAARQEALAWIDLGVFSHNAHARRLYNKFGFIEFGRVIDRFRVDNFRIDDIQMSLELSQYIPKFIGSFVQPQLLSDRLILEPIAEAHAEEIWALFSLWRESARDVS